MADPARGVAFVFASLLLMAAATLVAQRPPTPPRSLPSLTPPPSNQRGTAVISGRVYSAADGTPLRGADVAALANGAVLHATLSDADGRYELTGIEEAEWTVTATKAGFVLPRPAMRMPMQPVRSIRLSDGQRITVDFALQRGGVLTGTILDENGEPAADVRVAASRARMSRGTRLLDASVAVDTTDDTGTFRIHSLPAGDYYVSAALSATEATGQAVALHLPTYYPGTPSVAEATRISLRNGEERAGVSFMTAIARQVQLSGTLTDARGRPLKDVAVELISALDYTVAARAFGNFGMSRDGGQFTFVNIAPGSYFLSAQPDGQETAMLPVSVGTSDIAGLTLTMRRGTSMSGTVSVASGGSLPPGVKPTVVARAMRDDSTRTSPVEADNTFSVPGLLGTYRIEMQGLPDGWMVDAVIISGQSVADRLIEFGSVQQVSASITVTNLASSLSGQVMAEPGRAGDATVVVFSADPARWTYPSRYVQVTRTDASGSYRVRTLPPDDHYLAIAVDGLDVGEASDPDVLARLASSASRVSLGPGEHRTLDLRPSQP